MDVIPDLFDTHLHVDPDTDSEGWFESARRAGVRRFLVVGTDLRSSVAAARLARHADGVVAAAGVHPHGARHFSDESRFRELLQQPVIVAVGEIGLDYHYDHSPRDTQRRVLAAFLRLAAELDLPAVIHCREAFDDCLAVLQDVGVPGQRFEFHSFTGSPRQAAAVLELGGMISVNGMITFRRADTIREMLAMVPLDRLLLETDAPYLAPVPHRGRPNMPAYLLEVARRVAAEKGLSVGEVARATTANACRFFGIE